MPYRLHSTMSAWPNEVSAWQPNGVITNFPIISNNPKRNRTAFTSAHLNILEQEYRKSRYLHKTLRAELSAFLQIKDRAIKVWFQNRRMKEKKYKMENARSAPFLLPPVMHPQQCISVSSTGNVVLNSSGQMGMVNVFDSPTALPPPPVYPNCTYISSNIQMPPATYNYLPQLPPPPPYACNVTYMPTSSPVCTDPPMIPIIQEAGYNRDGSMPYSYNLQVQETPQNQSLPSSVPAQTQQDHYVPDLGFDFSELLDDIDEICRSEMNDDK